MNTDLFPCAADQHQAAAILDSPHRLLLLALIPRVVMPSGHASLCAVLYAPPGHQWPRGQSKHVAEAGAPDAAYLPGGHPAGVRKQTETDRHSIKQAQPPRLRQVNPGYNCRTDWAPCLARLPPEKSSVAPHSLYTPISSTLTACSTCCQHEVAAALNALASTSCGLDTPMRSAFL